MTHPTQNNTGGDTAAITIGAAWMREQADNAITYLEWDKVPEFSCTVGTAYAYQQGFNDAMDKCNAAIRAIPLPTDADLLAEAVKLPEVAALVEASRRLLRESELDGMEAKAGWDCWMGNLRTTLAPFTAAKETP